MRLSFERSVVRLLPSMGNVLGSVPSTERKKKKKNLSYVLSRNWQVDLSIYMELLGIHSNQNNLGM
jgi:hypothetical protein